MHNLHQRVEYVIAQAVEHQVLHEGYRYRLNVRRQQNIGCKGCCSIVGDHLRAVIENSHPPHSEVQLRLMSRLRHQVLEDAKLVQQIYENEISAMTSADDANIPSVSNVKSGL